MSRAPRFNSPTLWCLPCLVALSSCTGVIGDTRANGDPGDTKSNVEDDVSRGGVLGTACGTDGLEASVPRRLTRVEISNTLSDLFDVTVDPGSLPADYKAGDFVANRGVALSNGETQTLFDAMEAISTEVAEQISRSLGCTLTDSGCAETLIDRWAPLLYRRALLADERQRLVGFARSATDEGAGAGLQMTLHAMLASPQFNYVTDDAEGPEDTIRALSDSALLTRWALALWQAAPGPDLHELAQEHDLGTMDGRRAVVRTMIRDRRAERGLGDFHLQLLNVDTLNGEDIEAPEWTEETAAAARSEVRALTTDNVFEGGTFADLMTTPTGFVDTTLAELYGVDGAGPTTLGPERAGILTRVGVLSRYTAGERGSVVLRGHLVRTRLLCDVLVEPVAVDFEITDRLANETCRGCHLRMDPIGYGFDAYDAAGRFDPTATPFDMPYVHEQSRGERQDAVIGEFAGAVELGQRLASSPLAHGCYAEALLRWSARTGHKRWQRCAAETVTARLGLDAPVSEVVVELLSSDAFRAVGPARMAHSEPTEED